MMHTNNRVMVLRNSIHFDDENYASGGSTKTLCPRCTNSAIVTDTNGEVACTNCGYVVTQTSVELGKEWRSFSEDNHDRARTGGQTTLAKHDMGLNTTIGRGNKDSSGNPIKVSMKITMHRLRNWDTRSKLTTASDRNLSRAFNELNKLNDKLALNDMVLEKTAYIYRKAEENGLTKGRSIISLLAASVYVACRDTETPRNLTDIANASNVERKILARYYRTLIRELDLKMPIIDPSKYISRIANKAEISERSKRKALEIIGMAKDAKISSGKGPMGLAATALYAACVLNGESMTQERIAAASGVTSVTMRNRYRGLKTGLHIRI